MKKLSHQFDKPKRSVASPEALEALRNNNAVRWYVLSLPDCHRGGVRGLQREQDRRIQAGEPSFGFFAPSYQEVRRIDGKLSIPSVPYSSTMYLSVPPSVMFSN